MLRVLLLVFALCFPTKSYLNYSAVLPLDTYRGSHVEKLSIPPNGLDEINSGLPFSGQHVEFQDKHPFNNERNTALHEHRDGRAPSLDRRINKNGANPLLVNRRFLLRPFYNAIPQNYGNKQLFHHSPELRSILLREHHGGRMPNLDLRINKNIANPFLFDGRFPPRPFYDLEPYNYGCLNCYHCCHLYLNGPYKLQNSQFPLIVQKPRSTTSSTAISASFTTTTPPTKTTSPTAATPSTKKTSSTTTTTPSIATSSSADTIKPSGVTEFGISEST